MPPKANLFGERFGMLEVLAPYSEKKSNSPYWICKCDCGEVTKVRADLLTRGVRYSCGCIPSSNPRNSWASMISRCRCSNNIGWSYYGGRGITVDPKWATFDGFWEDMGSSYCQGLTIGRIDNNGGYTKDNCRWETYHQQARSASFNVSITFRGRTQVLTDWALELGMPVGTLWSRVKDYGWSIERALTEPVHYRGRRNVAKEVMGGIRQQ